MFAVWKCELTRGNSCSEFACADTLMEADGFDVFYSFVCSSVQVTMLCFQR